MKKRGSSTKKRRSSTTTPQSVTKRGSQRSASPRNQEESPSSNADRAKGLPATPTPFFKLESKPNRYRFMMGLVVMLGITSIYFYVDILLKLQNFYTLVFVVPLYGYIFGDIFLWIRTGVRSVEMDATGLSITFPRRLPVRRVAITEIGSVRVSSSIDGRAVYILLHGATSSKVLWMNFYSGPRIRIPEAPFDKQNFAEFVQRVLSIAPVVR